MMDTRKLDKWAEQLLDTGKRNNNLISFKNTRFSTAEVLFPSSHELFEKVKGIVSFEVFDPKDIEEINDDDEDCDDLISRKADYLALYSRKIRRQNQILVYNAVSSPPNIVKRIGKKAKEFIDETGVNVAYMVFGFIHWKESESSKYEFSAPVLLVPIQFKQASALEPCYIEPSDDDIVVNPTFSHKIEMEYGVRLPSYDDEGLNDYLEKVRLLIAKLGWTVTDECKIGIFSFLKNNMYRDLKDNGKAILSNHNIRRMMGESTSILSTQESDERDTSVGNPLVDLHNVIDADSSQIEAIRMAKSGKSFVLQGPPGTGKSQTITNIIAECLYDGKKVLFVSEKLAALNVVYDKLKKVGLSDFCLQLHSYKANKKAVISDIYHSLHEEKKAVSSVVDEEIAIKEKTLKQLDDYEYELHKQRPVIEKSLYQLYETYSLFRTSPDVEFAIPQLCSKGDKWLNEVVPLLEQYVDYIPSVGYDYRRNPWYGYVNQDKSYQSRMEVKKDISLIVQVLQLQIPLQKEISEKYGIQCNNMEQLLLWKDFFQFASKSKLLTPALLNRLNFSVASSALRELQALSSDIRASRSVLDSVFDNDVYRLNGAEYHKRLTRQFQGTFSRLLSREYKKIKTTLRSCKKDRRNASYAEAVAMMERLAYLQRKNDEYKTTESSIELPLGTAYKGIETEWDYITKQISDFGAILSKNIRFGMLEECKDFVSEVDSFADYSKRIEKAFELYDDEVYKRVAGYFDNIVLDINSAPSTLVLDKLNGCLEEIDKMDNWCHFRDLLSLLNGRQVVPYLTVCIQQNVEPRFIVGAFKKQFYNQWIISILSENPILSKFDRVSQDRAVRVFCEKDKEQFEINKAKIRAKLSSVRPELDLVASGSALSILLREGEKKKKQKSIRSLLVETGELVQKIKPCFLMSPLSVSTFLVTDSIRFDVVIFDEASQVFPQDAIGAIYRGRQLIVVGDSKQMPPSNFFTVSIEEDDNDEETGDITDFESILDLCSTCMQQLRLRWHYRSRFEQLIAFSNKNFYDGGLITFPSSKDSTSQGIGVDYYYRGNGLFDRKTHTNYEEAKFIVDLIYQNIEKYPKRSLGVVAFSVAQQDLIDKLLSKRRQCTPEKEFFFNAFSESEPFFVKNLETVQGDERDTIILSVAYGFDAQGRLLHNFGPLNRMGGERRLNVAVTRAKLNMQVVSSMRYTDIDLSRVSSEGAKLLRNYLDYAENGEKALERALSVCTFDQFDSCFENEVCDFLRSKGFSVDTQVGCSGFRIDLGLKLPNSSDYALAIECDGATYHSSKNARDRDRLRQEVLESMGWKFYRIWSTDWFRNKEIEQSNLLIAAQEAVKGSCKSEIKHMSSQQTETFLEASANNARFPTYEVANVSDIYKRYNYNCDNLVSIVRDILEIEAPLSEDWLLRRIVRFFHREKVTSFVRDSYEQQMKECRQRGIIRRNDFLYLENGGEIHFRKPGDRDDTRRSIEQISPEELSDGMIEILKQNGSVSRIELYRLLAGQCGVSRVGREIEETLDSVLKSIKKKGLISIEGEQVTIRTK